MKSIRLSKYITFKSLGLIVGGSLLFSLAMNLLIVPMSLYSGGFLGIAQLLREVLLRLGVQVENIDVAGIAYLLINVPLFLISLYYRVVVIRAPLQGLCYTVSDAVDWLRSPTA